MKKLTLAAGLMLAASCLTGCQKEENTAGGEVRSQTLTIISSPAQIDTRTVMEGDKASGFKTAWTQATDKLGVYVYSLYVPADALTNNAEFSITSVDNGSATFQGNINYASADHEYDLYAYYPRYASAFGTYTSVTVPLYTTQTMPDNGTYDPLNDYMVALPKKITVTGGAVNTPSIDDLEFRYLVGFMNLSIAEIAAGTAAASAIAPTDVVKSVMISTQVASGSSPALTGTFQLDLATGNQNFTSWAYQVSVNCPAGTTIGDLDLWAVVNPFTLTDAADIIKFTISTETHIIEKSATVAQLTGGSEFSIAAGGIKTFNMTIDDNCTITQKGLNAGVMNAIFQFDYTGGFSVDTWRIIAYQSPGVYFDGSTPKGNGWYCEFVAYPPAGDPAFFPDGEYTINSAQTEWTVYSSYRGLGSYLRLLENDVMVANRVFLSGSMTSAYSGGSYQMDFEGTVTGTTGAEDFTFSIQATPPM